MTRHLRRQYQLYIDVSDDERHDGGGKFGAKSKRRHRGAGADTPQRRTSSRQAKSRYMNRTPSFQAINESEN